MDAQKFLALFKEALKPDTEKVKQATATLRSEYYPQPESLAILLQLLLSEEDSSVRQLAATQARTLVSKHWKSIPSDKKPHIREQLLRKNLSEDEKLVRHGLSRVVAAVAKIDLADGEWQEIFDIMLQACNDSNPRSREVGTFVLFSTVESAGESAQHKFPDLLSTFNKTIQDPQSAETRINTMLALSRIAIILDSDEDAKILAAVQALIPKMVAVLKNAVDNRDEDRTTQAFEVFQTLLGCDSAVLNNSFGDLVRFMMNMAAEQDLHEDARTQAISFLMQCVRYRKLKVQGLKIGEQLTLKCLEIAVEIGDNDDDEEEITTARSALALIDTLASYLPPSQVVVPLLHALGPYVNSPDTHRRKAGILALGMCVEGAPDFIATQLKEIFPLILRLLGDSDAKVRRAALDGVMRLSEELPEDFAKEHEQLIPALTKILDMAMSSLKGPDDEENMDTIKACGNAIDALVDGLDEDDIEEYLTELVPRMSKLITHPDYKIKASAVGALGSMANVAKKNFLPYFESSMNSLSPYVEAKEGEDEIDLRCAVCDAMSNMAVAVGPETFQRYVRPLMQATEDALHLEHPKLKETSFLFWSAMAKVYEHEFKPFLEGAVNGVFESLGQEESDLEVDLGEEAADLAGKEITIGGKKIKVAEIADGNVDDLVEAVDIEDLSSGDLSDDDWNDIDTVTAVAQEKEIAVEVLGDIATHITRDFVPYMEKTIETVVPLLEHSYEGVRRGAAGTMLRIYTAIWDLQPDDIKAWKPGLPLSTKPTVEVAKLGEIVMTGILAFWPDEVDRATVTDINRNLAETFRHAGPALIAEPTVLKPLTETLLSILLRKHTCQQDLGDDESMSDLSESSEYDWLTIDTALDALIGIAVALGETFSELWKIFEKQLYKFASGSESYERNTSVGVIAECIRAMGPTVTPSTTPLLKILLHRLSDEDAEVKSNAAFAIGLLQEFSTSETEILKAFNIILSRLEPMLHMDVARAKDNAAGCVARMILRHPSHMPIEAVLPALVSILPLREDFEENDPVWRMILKLYQEGNETMQGQTRALVPVLGKVLGEKPEGQLKEGMRNEVVELVKYIAGKEPGLVEGDEGLRAVLGH